MAETTAKKRFLRIAAIIAVIAVLIAVAAFVLYHRPEKTDEVSPVPSATATAPAKPQETASGGEKRILLIETSDIHGYLMDTSSGDEKTYQYRLAYIANVINNARASDEYDGVVLVDGGDIYQGSPASNLVMGASLVAAMDAMQYDAVVLGNHEFDWDVQAYAADENGTLPAYSIGPFSGDPDIPVLASNLYDASSGKRVSFTKDYVIVEKEGIRIALIGYIPDYSSTIMTKKIRPFSIDQSLPRLKKRIKEINEEEKPDVTVVMTHEDPGPLAEAMDPDDVQLVTGGHTHTGLTGISSDGIPYIQADCYAKSYASALITVSADGTVSVSECKNTDIIGEKKALYDTAENAEHLDQTVLSISKEAWTVVEKQMEEVLGYISVPVSKDIITGDNGSTTAGNWITGLMLRATRKWETVAAFYNSGGIRTNLTIPKRESRRAVTAGDIYTIAPFGNSLLVYEVTGAELAEQIRDGLVSTNYGDQMSGLTFTYTVEETSSGIRYTVTGITLYDGTEVDLSDPVKRYRVCVSNFSATLPGSVFEKKTPLYSEADAPIDNIAFIDLLKQEARDNGGIIFVDGSPRGFLETEEVAVKDAA